MSETTLFSRGALHELFQSGAILEITSGPFKGFFGFLKNFKLYRTVYLGRCSWWKF
jgi:hypothetical protein